MNKNIGTIAGKTVNGTEAIVEKMKNTTPKVKDGALDAKDASKAKIAKGWKNIKAAYAAAREGEVVYEAPVVIRGELPVGEVRNRLIEN